ncbi:MAG: T9SS type A sorting domain-containing protein [Saprospiraceae bacterium]|nr:T9SS type A sorting domain-containing protein [Saprospiraceae bacterium]
MTSLLAQTVIPVSGEITSNTTWTKNNTYLLTGFVYVEDGATLTIQAGTVVKGDKATKGALIVTRTGKINAQGTADEPIVFTSNETEPDYGDWGGVIILGNAPTNASSGGNAGVGVIEGGVDTPEGDGLYGGTNAADNSGVFSYVRIEYPGIAFQPNNEINGLTMGGVGNGTKIDHVQVSYSGDDAFEWFGGTVNCKNLIAYRTVDDDFDADFGFSGNIQFAFSVRDPEVADVSGSNGFEVDNDGSGSTTTPKTRPTFSNVTIIGPSGATIAADYKRAAHLRRNCEVGIYNSLLIGNYPVGLFIDGAATVANAQGGLLEVKNTLVAGPTELLKTTDAAFNIADWYGTSGWGNATSANTAGAMLTNPFNLDAPNAFPLSGSPALSGAAFSAARLSNAFFTPTTYIGAFGGVNTDWTCRWAKFLTVSTACTTDTDEANSNITEAQLLPTVVSDEATLNLSLAQSADVRIDLLGLNGQYLGQLSSINGFSGEQSVGIHVAQFDNGLYFLRIQAGAAVKVVKMIVAH